MNKNTNSNLCVVYYLLFSPHPFNLFMIAAVFGEWLSIIAGDQMTLSCRV